MSSNPSLRILGNPSSNPYTYSLHPSQAASNTHLSMHLTNTNTISNNRSSNNNRTVSNRLSERQHHSISPLVSENGVIKLHVESVGQSQPHSPAGHISTYVRTPSGRIVFGGQRMKSQDEFPDAMGQDHGETQTMNKMTMMNDTHRTETEIIELDKILNGQCHVAQQIQ